MTNGLTVALALFISIRSAAAEPVADVENKVYILCKNKKQVRTVRIQVGADGVCSTYYNKDGAEKMVGSGRNHDSCVHFLTNVKTNLEKSNWTCRDISSSRMTAGAE